MADESPLNTFDLSVVLPINDASPPFIFFQIFFTCNGVTFSSDQMNNAEDTLEWAQDELASFGTWTVVNNTLYLSDSLCGVGSIYLIVSAIDQGGSDAEGSMDIDDSSPVAILDIFGAGLIDVSVNHSRVTDSEWIANMLAIGFKYGDPFPDPISHWNHLIPSGGGDGYNILESEALLLGKTLATVQDGVGNETYGYDFIDGEYSDYLPLLGINETILSVNISTLLMQVIGTSPVNVAGIDFTDSYAEWEFFISIMAANGVTIRSIQLSTEMGISGQSLIVHAASDVKNICDVIIAYFRTNHPSFTIYSDAYQVDDTTNLLDDYNSTLATMDTEGARQYFQLNEDSYETTRERIYEFGGVLVKFRQQFPGKKMRIQQSIVKPDNPIRNKVGEGLAQAELWMHVIKENINQNGLVTDLTLYTTNRLIGATNNIHPLYYFTLLAAGMFHNDGMIEVDFENENLEVLGVVDGAEIRLYVINHSADFQSETIALNGTLVAYSTEAYYGDIYDSVANHYEAGGNAGTSVLFYPHSLTKIII